MYKEIGILFKRKRENKNTGLKMPSINWKLNNVLNNRMPSISFAVTSIPKKKEIDTNITECDKGSKNSLF